MVECWLVERDVYDEDLVTLVYATPDGERAVTLQWSANLVVQKDLTAARDVDETDLEPVGDSGRRERYATEVERMRERHDPDDPV
jgi:hypothetical protein